MNSFRKFRSAGSSTFYHTAAMTLLLLLSSPALFAQSPGGISDSLLFWLDASDLNNDGGTTNPGDGSSVDNWYDLSGATTHDFDRFVDTATFGQMLAPVYRTNEDAINFNPSIDFSGSNAGLSAADDNEINLQSDDRRSIAIVFRTSASPGTGTDMIYEEGSTVNGINFYTSNSGNLEIGAWANGAPTSWSHWENQAVSASQVYLAVLVFDGIEDSVLSAYVDGALLGTSAKLEYLPAHSGNIGLGQTRDGTRLTSSSATGSNNTHYFEGQISELVYYNQDLTDSERRCVESYLALKYGISLSGDYTSSNSTVIWDDAHNASYNNDVTGIGRDDNANLNQKQSRSSSNNGVLSIGLDTVHDSNADNTASFASDRYFLFWGSNGLAANATTSGIPAGQTHILERNWYIKEPSGDVGVVDLNFDMTAFSIPGTAVGDFTLLVKNGSNDFTSGATEHSAASYDGSTLIFDDINLADGDYLTLASNSQVIGPGGVTSSLDFWFASDTATNVSGGRMTSWSNLATNTTILRQDDSGERPSFSTSSNLINYHPTVSFNGTDEYLALNNYSLTTGLDQVFACVLFRSSFSGSSSTDNWALLDFDRSEYFNLFLRGSNGGVTFSYAVDGSNRDFTSSTTNYNDGFPHLACGCYDNSITNDTKVRVDGSLEYDQDRETTGTDLGQGTTNTRYGFVGDGSEASTYDGDRNDVWYDGDISELFLFEGISLSSTEVERIETYMVVKYGIHLDHDYVASNGVAFWDTSVNATYHNGVMALGRDDDSGLEQKQTSSNNNGGVLSIGLGSIAASNADNANSVGADLRFLAMGHDGDPADSETTGVPTGYDNILSRVWLVEEYGGDAGNIELSFDLDNMSIPGDVAGDFSLVVKNGDADFTTGASEYVASSITSNQLSITGVNLADGDYFTLVSSGNYNGPAPGGAITSLELWFASDSALTTSGSAVSSWGNSAPKSPGLSQSSSGARPTELSADPDFNYKSVIQFDGGSDYLALDQLALTGTYDQVTTCAVFRTGFSGPDYDDNWALIDFDRSEYFNFYVEGDGQVGFSYSTASATDNSSSASTFNDSIPHVACAIYDNTQANDTQIRVDGSVELNTDRESLGAQIGSGTAETRYGFIGDGSEASSFSGSRNNVYFEGSIGEVLLYFDQTHSSLELEQIETYLALKFGIPLSHDYVASNDTVIWDAAAMNGYNNDIAGIGRDDASGLDTRKSRSSTTNDLLTVWLGASADESSPTAFTQDLSFLMWGHDGGTIDTSIRSEIPSGIAKRIPREWQFVERDNISLRGAGPAYRDVGQITIQFDLTRLTDSAAVHPDVNDDSLNTLRLLLSSSADFSAATIYSPTAVSSANRTISFTLPGAAIGSGSFITMGGSSESPLPITLSQFEAAIVGDSEQLIWATQSEIAASHFEIERSSDGINWEKRAEVKTMGDIERPVEYLHFDPFPLPGESLYRLKMVDLDGSFEYYPLRAVFYELPAVEQAQIAPNPSSGNFNLKFWSQHEQMIYWYIQASDGRIVYNGSKLAQKGYQSWGFDKDLEPGYYVLYLRSEGSKQKVNLDLLILE